MLRLLSLLILLNLACSRNSEPVAYSEPVVVPTPPTAKLASSETVCELNISSLEGNQYFDTEQHQLIAVVADSTNWRLQVYDRRDCSLLRQLDLPVASNPDYPYYLADLLYNSGNRLLGIRGFEDILIYDLDNGVLSDPIRPEFQEERLQGADAGQVEHLEVWENYLVGCSSDWGSFAFRLDSLELTPILPVAELEKAGQFHSLFLIESGQTGRFQAVLPAYDYEEGVFRINPLFEAPIALTPEETIYASGSPYARLRKSGADLVGVDLIKREVINGIESIKVEE